MSGWIIASSKRRPLVRFSFPRVFVDAASCAISSVPAASSGFECPGGCKRGGPSKWGHGPFSCFVSALFCLCSESFPALVYYVHICKYIMYTGNVTYPYPFWFKLWYSRCWKRRSSSTQSHKVKQFTSGQASLLGACRHLEIRPLHIWLVTIIGQDLFILISLICKRSLRMNALLKSLLEQLLEKLLE